MRNSSLIILEVIWSATALFCLVASIRLTVTDFGTKAVIFALMALISFLFAWLRRNQRKKS